MAGNYLADLLQITQRKLTESECHDLALYSKNITEIKVVAVWGLDGKRYSINISFDPRIQAQAPIHIPSIRCDSEEHAKAMAVQLRMYLS